MIKFKKPLIAIFIVLAFFREDANGYSLRVPMSFSESQKDRALGLIVISKIQEFQREVRGIKSDTVTRKIKKEFDESVYRLQERVRIGDNDNFYVRSSGEYFEIINGEIKASDKTAFEQAHRILIKVINKSYSKNELIAEVTKVTAKLHKKLKRQPNIKETAEAMPSLAISRNPAALLYKHFQSHKLNPYDYGVSKFSGNGNTIIKKSPDTDGMSFMFRGIRIFLPVQLSNRIEVSSENILISKETKIDIVDRKDPGNRLTVEHAQGEDTLRLIYIRPSGEEVVSEVNGMKDKTSVTLTLNPVFSDFYDTVFSIPLYQGEERLRAVAKHLNSNRFGTSFEQQEKYVNFHGHLYLPSFYNTHPGRIKVYRDRENWARFLIFEDITNPDNVVGYEWRLGRIISLERDPVLKINGYVSMDDKEMPIYYLHRSNVFREFDQRLDKSINIITASSNDRRLLSISMGTGRFSFRVKENITVISFEGERSNGNKTRDDRAMYPIRIVRLDDKSEIKIGYKDPLVQGEFTVEGLNWEDGTPIVLKGPAGYEGNRGYFNISTITEMLRRRLLRGIKASNRMLETFDFYEGATGLSPRNPVRSYKIKSTESGEKVLVEDILVDPRTFLPWHDKEAYYGFNSKAIRTGI